MALDGVEEGETSYLFLAVPWEVLFRVVVLAGDEMPVVSASVHWYGFTGFCVWCNLEGRHDLLTRSRV